MKNLRALKVSIFPVLVISLAFAIQEPQPQPIPQYEGDGDSMHDGQPRWCQNFDTKQYVHNCDCQPKMGDQECKDKDRGGENPKCSVYCRKTACRCQRDCGRTE